MYSGFVFGKQGVNRFLQSQPDDIADGCLVWLWQIQIITGSLHAGDDPGLRIHQCAVPVKYQELVFHAAIRMSFQGGSAVPATLPAGVRLPGSGLHPLTA